MEGRRGYLKLPTIHDWLLADKLQLHAPGSPLIPAAACCLLQWWPL